MIGVSLVNVLNLFHCTGLYFSAGTVSPCVLVISTHCERLNSCKTFETSRCMMDFINCCPRKFRSHNKGYRQDFGGLGFVSLSPTMWYLSKGFSCSVSDVVPTLIASGVNWDSWADISALYKFEKCPQMPVRTQFSLSNENLLSLYYYYSVI